HGRRAADERVADERAVTDVVHGGLLSRSVDSASVGGPASRPPCDVLRMSGPVRPLYREMTRGKGPADDRADDDKRTGPAPAAGDRHRRAPRALGRGPAVVAAG